MAAGSGLFISQVALKGLMNSQYLVNSLRDLERLSEEDPSLSPQTKCVTLLKYLAFASLGPTAGQPLGTSQPIAPSTDAAEPTSGFHKNLPRRREGQPPWGERPAPRTLPASVTFPESSVHNLAGNPILPASSRPALISLFLWILL